MTNVYFFKSQGEKSNSIKELKRKQQFFPIKSTASQSSGFQGLPT